MMRKGLTLVILMILVTVTASAQLRLGPKFGGNFSRIDYHPDEFQPANQSYKFGFQGGWVFNWQLTDMFSIQQEILFAQKGNKTENTYFDTTFTGGMISEVLQTEEEAQLNLNYIDLPLMFRFSFGDPHDKQFFVNAGPRVSFLVGGNRASSTEVKRVVPDDPDFKDGGQSYFEIDEDFYENAEFGFDLGVGYDINTGPGHLIIDLRYKMGVSDIINEGQTTQAILAKNQGIALSLMYLFGNTKPEVEMELE